MTAVLHDWGEEWLDSRDAQLGAHQYFYHSSHHHQDDHLKPLSHHPRSQASAKTKLQYENNLQQLAKLEPGNSTLGLFFYCFFVCASVEAISHSRRHNASQARLEQSSAHHRVIRAQQPLVIIIILIILSFYGKMMRWCTTMSSAWARMISTPLTRGCITSGLFMLWFRKNWIVILLFARHVVVILL